MLCLSMRKSCRLYFRYAQYELWRQEKLGQVSNDELLRLASVAHEWEELLEHQEAEWERELLGKETSQ